MSRGNLSKRSATPIGDGTGGVVAFSSDDRVTLAIDAAQAAAAYAVLLTQALTLPVTRTVDVTFTWSIAVSAASIGAMAIFVDGVRQQSSGAWVNNLVAQLSGAVSWRGSLAAGAHTITARWQNVGGGGAGLLCRPVTNPDFESASMRTMVLESI